ncbi:hypothetical protein C2G38_2182860 [Gigaspora rosea]|uniref:TLDc domain-containing protein n=1 Tax=Gigaspora rosea TaxID=44941 RepID=A0A397VAU9_9GLOM|nr:hypothetical protein C2G38_2182860 [Gigaspora rosea]
MIVACEFLFDELVNQLQTHLIEKEANWLRLHLNYIYQKKEFLTLQENVLVSLISRDDLQLEEIKIWNYFIKWGIEKNPSLPSDSEDWSYENFIALKTTLQNCLPHIRYFQMSVKDNPYEFKLLPRRSKDGFTRYSFWNLCDKKIHHAVVMKVKGTDEILGGYNPIGWNKHYHNQHRNDTAIYQNVSWATYKVSCFIIEEYEIFQIS